MKNFVIDTSYNKSVPNLGQTQTNGELTSTSASPLAKSLMTNNDNKSATKIKRSSFLSGMSPRRATGHPSKIQSYKTLSQKRGGGMSGL